MIPTIFRHLPAIIATGLAAYLAWYCFRGWARQMATDFGTFMVAAACIAMGAVVVGAIWL